MSFVKYDPEAPKSFARHAQLCIKVAKETMNVDFRYDLESVKKLDDLVTSIGTLPTPQRLAQIVVVIGSFLGETLCQVYHGRWEFDDTLKTWAVRFKLPDHKEEGANVFFKVEKRFKNGMEDSISFFAHVIDGRIKGIIP